MGFDNTAIRAARLSKTYGHGDDRVTVLNEVDVTVQRGEFAAIMGGSGSGKSTLMHLLAGLERPTEGQVWLGGTKLSSLDDDALTTLRRDRVGFIFQAYNLLPALTVAENILLPFELAGRRPDRTFADTVIDAVGLGDRLRHRPGQLSGGQRQRVATARALILKPDVVFADEPTAALDPPAAQQIVGVLKAAAAGLLCGETASPSPGQTVVMVTHDPAAAAAADRVCFVERGRIATQLREPTPDLVGSRLEALAARQGTNR